MSPSAQASPTGDSDREGAVDKPWSVSELVRYGWTWNESITEEQPPGVSDEELETRRRNTLETTSLAYPLPPASL